MIDMKFTKENSRQIKRYTCGIYAIRNDLNGKMYIGSSTDIQNRYKSHYRDLCNNKGINKKLQKDFNNIGSCNFSFIIIEECADNINTIRYLESKYIKEYGYYNCNDVDGKKVYCYDKQGNYIKEYNTIRDAARELGALSDNIKGCCNGRKKSCCGFQWSYNKVDNIGEYHKKEYEIKNNKPIVQLDYNGNNVIGVYDSIREASRITGICRQSISDGLRTDGRHKHAGGFTWKRL